MKILHSIGSFVNGGIETLLTNVVNRQVAEGNSVAIMIVTDKWSQEMIDALDRRIKVFYINKPIGSHNPWYLLKLLHYYKSFKADILHLHSPGSEKLFTPKNNNERRIVTIHNETIAIPFSKTVDQYIAISQCVLESFKQKTGHDNCIICYNGIDISKFKCKKEYSKKPYKMVALGRILFNVKAQDLIVEAISKLPIEIRKDIHLDIIGDGKDADILKTLVKELGIEDNVTLIGNVPNTFITENLCKYDLLLCASHHEGLGITAIEGMAAGVPLLLSDALGYIEVTENGEYGKHFKHSDTEAIKEAIICAYENYGSICLTAKKSIEYAKEKFSIERYMINLAEIYHI